jgi:hypothetical protein
LFVLPLEVTTTALALTAICVRASEC